jgi:uncharacterized repeat protein (TIGR01451 family)
LDDWHDNSDSAQAVSDIFYKIVVSNTGAYPLANVEVEDTTLGLNKNVGSLAVGDSVTYVPENPQGDEVAWSDLKLPGFCDRNLALNNTAKVSGDVVGENDTVTDQDDALFTCVLASGNICDQGGKPNVLWLLYDADDDTSIDGTVDASTIVIDPAKVDFPEGPVKVRIYGSVQSDTYEVFADDEVNKDDPLRIEQRIANPYKIPNVITVKIWEQSADITDDPIQTILFHGSCSEPLVANDEYGAITIWYAEWN